MKESKYLYFEDLSELLREKIRNQNEISHFSFIKLFKATLRHRFAT